VPIVVENDANAAGLAEARALNPPSDSVVYVTVSTGIGTGLVINNQIDPSWRHSEGGFMHFDKNGQLLPWEKFASGQAIKERYGKIAADIPADDLAWAEIAYDLALGLSNIAALLAPKTIIIGGGVGEHLPKFKSHLDEAMSRLKEKMFALPEIRQAAHPEEAVVYGCYYLVKDSMNA
jgi:predicted NBD/HSP70 family sugar kinase